jgi:transcriptional regulator with XRE-family HTH domain
VTNGERLKEWRTRNNYSMDAVAAWLAEITRHNTSLHTIRRWERNQYVPRKVYADAIYKITNGEVNFAGESRVRFLEVKPERIRKPIVRKFKCRRSSKS